MVNKKKFFSSKKLENLRLQQQIIQLNNYNTIIKNNYLIFKKELKILNYKLEVILQILLIKKINNCFLFEILIY